ncbi:MAG: hypothetical protein PHQ19_03700 [Candidatus Krumholzibacteria bacterium]|nr:hypothetical protein [Candidatus Krumholzibacteria bacterium]
MHRKGIAIVSLLALAAFLLLTSFASAQQSGPKLMIRDKEPDLGDFYEGTDIDYAFTIRNTGIGELHILSVRPG